MNYSNLIVSGKQFSQSAETGVDLKNSVFTTVLNVFLYVDNTAHFLPSAFVSESLIEAIHSDIREAEQALGKPENKEFASHSFFNKTESAT